MSADPRATYKLVSIKQMIKAKGYTCKEFGELIGVKPRQMSNIVAEPKHIHFLALKGLPDKPSGKHIAMTGGQHE